MMNRDNDKTVARPWKMQFRATPNSDTEHGANVLPVGTHLGEFEILDLIGEGGFGIVYLAYDHSLERHVALKEYMPSGLATRTARMAVTVRSQHNAATFTAGLKSFVNEARMLAQFDSPSLVKVYRFWEGNGTAYMVMPFYEGITLKQALKEHRITPSEPWIRLLLADLFDAIETIHRAQCLHRDIAPDNILLLRDGRPLLLDFGAARRVIGDLTQCLTVILKPGFAPLEQYADIADLRQGAWTDIYALAAVVYYLIAGKAPPPAVARMVHDELVPAHEAGKGRYSNAFLAVLDKALAVKPEQRFKSIAELRRALDIMEIVPRTTPRTTAQGSTRGARTIPMAEPKPNVKPDAQSAAPPDNDRQKPRRMGNAVEGKPRLGKPEWLILGLLLSAGIAAGVYWGTNRTGNTAPEQSVAASGGKPIPDSSGSSGEPEQEPANRTATTAPAKPSSPPPATKAPSSVANMASTAPRTDEVPAPKPGRAQSAAPASRKPSEIELWRNASTSDKAGAYERYLKEYPQGRYATLARLRLERKQPKAETAAPNVTPPSLPQDAKSKAAPPAAAPKTKAPSAEEELWNMAVTINEAPSYEAYLGKYPHGRYAPLAKDKLASIKPAEPAAPSPPPTVAQPQVPAAAPAEPNAPAEADKQASIKPPEPSAPSPAPNEPQEATPKPAPEPPVAAGKKILTPDGQTMTGDFSVDPKTGSVSGTGKIVWANGDRFEGTLVRGVKEGKGQFTWNDGQRYIGDWAKDMPNGKGTIAFANGNRYEGDVKDGLPHGQGVTRFKGGDVYSGAWVKGKSEGHGRYTWANGSYWEGEFNDDKRTENGKMVFSDSAGTSSASAPPSAMGEAQDPAPPAADKEPVDK